MVETTSEQKMKMCPHCRSENGSYNELLQKLHERDGLHYTYSHGYKTHKSWRGGPKDTPWRHLFQTDGCDVSN